MLFSESLFSVQNQGARLSINATFKADVNLIK